VAAYKQEMEAQCGADNVTLVDAGDAIQGSAIGTLSDGAYLVDIMNQVGYDYAVPGNHEFDYGMDNFLSLAAGEDKRAEYTYLCANFRDKDSELLFQPYEIVDYGPVQVAYVGISTPETISKSTPVHFQDENGTYIYSFGGEVSKLYEDVQSAVDQARQEGADYVVAVAHLGQTGITQAWRSDTVVAHTTGIDVMFDGHSHEQYQQQVQNKDGEEVLVLQTGHNLTALGKVTIDTASGEIAGELVTDYDGSEAETAGLLESLHAQLDGELEAQIGTLTVDLAAEDEQENQLVRSQETNLGDFCADAYRAALQADVALVNGGGIRANVSKGTVTYGDIISVHPYNNQLSVAEVTGQQLLDALEMGARLYPEPCAGFLQVSGMTYEIDTSVPSHVVVDDKAAFVKVDGEYRVKNVKVGGAPLDLQKTYRVASHDYMLKQGGDGMTMFQNCNIPESEVMLDNQALIRYMDGFHEAEYQNRDGQGRIQRCQTASASKPLTPKPLAPNAVTPNPYLSPGDSVIHNDSYSSDVTGAVLPLGIHPTVTSASDKLNAASCPSSVLYDRYGSAITQLNGGLCIADLDTDGIPRAGSFTPPFKDPAQPALGREYLLQTSYSMVDAQDHIIAPTSHGHVFYLKTRDENGEILPTFEKVLDVDISGLAAKALGKEKLDTRLLSVIYDYSGNLWFVTGGFLVDPARDAEKYGSGFLGYLSRDYIEQALAGNAPENIDRYIHFLRLNPGEGAENGISANEAGAVVLTNTTCYLLNASEDGVKVEWKTDYRSDGQKTAVGGAYQGTGLAWGGGSTPTLTRDLVLFTDNQKTVHLLALDIKTGKVVADTPVLDLGDDTPVSVENSILVYSGGESRASVVICNWYGAGNAGLATGDSSVQTWANIYDADWMAEGNRHIAPGVTRVDVVKQADGSYTTETKWLRKDIRETAMVKLSTATGYLYGYWQVDGDDTWRYEMLDFETGETAFSYGVSDDPAYNNMAVGMIPSPAGNGLYCPTNTAEKYLLCLRDSFAYLPENSAASLPLSGLGRESLSAGDFQKRSGTADTPASYLLRAELSGVTEPTTLTFLVNGLEGDPSRYILYRENADGSFSPVSKDSWSLAEGSQTLKQTELYPLAVSLAAGETDVSVILTVPGQGGADLPETPMTRGMLIAALHELAGSPDGTSSVSFLDVDGTVYAEAVRWAAGQGIIAGYPDGTFGPDDRITREQLAVILYRYAGSPSSSAALEFPDTSLVSSYAQPAMRWAVDRGLLSGKSGGLLDPKGGVTQTETAAIFEQYLKNK